MAELRIADAAHLQLAEIDDFFHFKNPEAGHKILSAIEEAILKVAKEPGRFPSWHYDPIAKFCVVSSFPQYAIFFEFDEEYIDILAVWDCRQDPKRLIELLA